MTLAEARARIDQWVKYTAIPARPEHDGEDYLGRPIRIPFEPAKVEMGVITSVNDTYVFVRYVGRWQSQATRPEDLEWYR